MRIGILSDTHNNLGNLKRALEVFEGEGITTLIFLGDLTRADLVEAMRGFTVHYLIGNMEQDPGAIQANLKAINADNTAGLTYMGEYDGVRIAATHGHHEAKLEAFIQSGDYAFVFHGHTHKRRDETIGETRVINPGALGGMRRGHRSVCMVDTEKREVAFVKIADW